MCEVVSGMEYDETCRTDDGYCLVRMWVRAEAFAHPVRREEAKPQGIGMSGDLSFVGRPVMACAGRPG